MLTATPALQLDRPRRSRAHRSIAHVSEPEASYTIGRERTAVIAAACVLQDGRRGALGPKGETTDGWARGGGLRGVSEDFPEEGMLPSIEHVYLEVVHKSARPR